MPDLDARPGLGGKTMGERALACWLRVLIPAALGRKCVASRKLSARRGFRRQAADDVVVALLSANEGQAGVAGTDPLGTLLARRALALRYPR